MSFKFTDLIIMIRKPIVFPLTSAAPLKASRRSFDSAYPLANICTNSMSFKFHELNHHDKETNSISHLGHTIGGERGLMVDSFILIPRILWQIPVRTLLF